MKTNKIIIVNGYTIKFNPMWEYWQVSHENVGANIAQFNELEEAVNYCSKG